MKKLISIIIPCYNSGKYVSRCYASLQNQSLGIENLELIFVNDASTDNTYQCLLTLEAACPDSIAIIQCEERQYPGGARNIGLSYASADYVAFLEPEDWAEPEMYEALYHSMLKHSCDIVKCSHITNYGSKSSAASESNPSQTDELLLMDSVSKRKSFLLTAPLGASLTDKLLRLQFLTDHDICFLEHTYYEHISWLSLVSLYADRIVILKKDLCHHSLKDHSVLLYKDTNYHFDYLQVNLHIWAEWTERGLLELYKEELCFYFLNTCYLGYLKVLFTRFSQIPFEQYLLLKQEVLSRVSDYEHNIYIDSYATHLNRILLELLRKDISLQSLEEIALTARSIWSTITIFTATHVAFSPPADPIYVPIHVGRAAGQDLGYLGDDTGDSISAKNCFYSELTALYWIWKNDTQSDYAGLCHYRRYFLNDAQTLMTKKDFINILSAYDVIISKLDISTQSYSERYEESHNINDLHTIGEVIRRIYPEYSPYFEAVMSSNESCCGNLFVAPRLLFQQYANWLFTVFDEAAKQIDTTGYDAYHRRVFGFLSEQLLLVWVKANHLNFYPCEIGFSQEKAETSSLKQALADFIRVGDVVKAFAYFSGQIKERPDVLLTASDFKQELKVIYQILNVCVQEQTHGVSSLLSYSKDLDLLLPHYLHVTEILSRMAADCVTEKDRSYLKLHSVSRPGLQAIIDASPSYQGIVLNQFNWD